jgi:general secretion pathway protein I
MHTNQSIAQIRNSRQAGFSLLEVLVAFAILALALGVLFQVFTSGMRNTQIAARHSEAMIIAESRLAELAAGDLEEGGEQGESGDFHWSTQTIPYELDEAVSLPTTSLMELSVRVEWSDYGKRRSIALNTLRVAEEQR